MPSMPASAHPASGQCSTWNIRPTPRRTGTAFGLLCAICAAILWRFPPESYHFYPVCPVYRYLHLACPGCGTTRALAALLHGHLREAIRYNALTVLGLLPSGAAYAVVSLKRGLAAGNFQWPSLPPVTVYTAAATAFAFTLARNFL